MSAAMVSLGMLAHVSPGVWSLFGVILAIAGAAVLTCVWLVGVLEARPQPADPADGPVPRAPRWWRWGAPLIDPLSVHLAPWFSIRARFAVLERLRRAGLDAALSADRYRAGQYAAAVVAAAAVSIVWSPAGVVPLWLLFTSAALGFVSPETWLSDRIQTRMRAVLRELPFYLDVITLAVESGLNLSAALAQAADKGPPGPLRDEFERVLRDLRAGRARADALRAMAERLALPAVGSLVAALIVAEQQGSALAPILRAQAEQRRSERFQRAEKLAMEAPVKMLVPLLLFIFPCTFAVLLFPVVGRMLIEGWLK